MPDKCTFCPSTAKLSGEHIWSEWMGKLFVPIDPEVPSGVHFSQIAKDGSTVNSWSKAELDLKAKVVCKKCNNTWMSDIEGIAKTAMAELILGRKADEITAEQAHGISIFAFKTAIITDRMAHGDFFDVSLRYAFRHSPSIPANVTMWLFGMHVSRPEGAIRSRNINWPDAISPDLTLNVCSFFIAHLGFQVLCVKADKVQHVISVPVPPDLLVPFYPHLARGISWPRNTILDPEYFDNFAARWDRVRYK